MITNRSKEQRFSSMMLRVILLVCTCETTIINLLKLPFLVWFFYMCTGWNVKYSLLISKHDDIWSENLDIRTKWKAFSKTSQMSLCNWGWWFPFELISELICLFNGIQWLHYINSLLTFSSFEAARSKVIWEVMLNKVCGDPM